jgi:hypothetical protein
VSVMRVPLVLLSVYYGKPPSACPWRRRENRLCKN